MLLVEDQQQDERSEKLTAAAAAAKKKVASLHKFQSKKANHTDSLEQENIILKEKLFRAREQVEWMEHEIRSLREKNTELQQLFAADFLSDGGEESLVFSDRHTLEAYEREERAIFESFKKRLHDLKERFRYDSAELCSSCMGEMIEI